MDGHQGIRFPERRVKRRGEGLLDRAGKQRNEGGPSELELHEESNGAMRSVAHHEFGRLKCVKVISDSGMKRKLEMMTGGREKTK